jgi:hypothetical protein
LSQQEPYKKTPYLKSIRLIAKSEVKEAKFNVRLYSPNAKGDPGEMIYHKTLIGIAPKGINKTLVNLDGLGIKFPLEVLFIAIEWLYNEENRHEFSYSTQGSRKNILAFLVNLLFLEAKKKVEVNNSGIIKEYG